MGRSGLQHGGLRWQRGRTSCHTCGTMQKPEVRNSQELSDKKKRTWRTKWNENGREEKSAGKDLLCSEARRLSWEADSKERCSEERRGRSGHVVPRVPSPVMTEHHPHHDGAPVPMTTQHVRWRGAGRGMQRIRAAEIKSCHLRGFHRAVPLQRCVWHGCSIRLRPPALLSPGVPLPELCPPLPCPPPLLLLTPLFLVRSSSFLCPPAFLICVGMCWSCCGCSSCITSLC